MDCQCTHLLVDTGKVGSILERGGIPRFIFQETDGSLDIEVSDPCPYVAFSHVWADGLGNARANSLPICQFKRLWKYVVALSEGLKSQLECLSLGFWIDTLGVPLQRDRRKIALKSLPRAYEFSSCCLVLDEELLRVPAKTSVEEICMRIVLSTWSRRLWTFQEGVLTWDKLFFQLHEGPVQLLDFRNDENQSYLYSSLRLECLEEAVSRASQTSKTPLTPSSGT